MTYLVVHYYLDQGAEGWPSLTIPRIVTADSEESAEKAYYKDPIVRTKNNYGGPYGDWGFPRVLGHIDNGKFVINPEFEFDKAEIEHIYKIAIPLGINIGFEPDYGFILDHIHIDVTVPCGKSRGQDMVEDLLYTADSIGEMLAIIYRLKQEGKNQIHAGIFGTYERRPRTYVYVPMEVKSA